MFEKILNKLGFEKMDTTPHPSFFEPEPIEVRVAVGLKIIFRNFKAYCQEQKLPETFDNFMMYVLGE